MKKISNTLAWIVITGLSISFNAYSQQIPNCDSQCETDLKHAKSLLDEGKSKEAAPIMEKHCQKSVGLACFSLGVMHKESGDKEKSIQLFNKACNTGFPMGCAIYMQSINQGNHIEELVIDNGSPVVLEKDPIKYLHVKNNSKAVLKHKVYDKQESASVKKIYAHDTSSVDVINGLVKSIDLHDKSKLKVVGGKVKEIEVFGQSMLKIRNNAEIDRIVYNGGSGKTIFNGTKIKLIYLHQSSTTKFVIKNADIENINIGAMSKLVIVAKNAALVKNKIEKAHIVYLNENGNEKKIYLSGTLDNIQLDPI